MLTGGGGICGVCQHGRLPAPRPGDLHAAVSVPEGRQPAGSPLARRSPPRRSRDRLRRRVRADVAAGGEHPQGRARAARRADPLRRTRASATCRWRSPPTEHDADGGRGRNNPNEAPAGYYMLFVVDAAGVPSVSKVVRLARARSPARRAGQPGAQPPGHEQHAVRHHRGPREGRSTAPCPAAAPTSGAARRWRTAGSRWTSARTARSRTFIVQPLGRRRRERGVQHARLPHRDAHGAPAPGARRRRSPATRADITVTHGGAARRALGAPRRDGRRAGQRRRARPDLRARGVRGDRAAGRHRRAADGLLGPRRHRPGTALRGRRATTWRAGNLGPGRRRCHPVGGRRAGLSRRRCAPTAVSPRARRCRPGGTQPCRRASTSRSARCAWRAP